MRRNRRGEKMALKTGGRFFAAWRTASLFRLFSRWRCQEHGLKILKAPISAVSAVMDERQPTTREGYDRLREEIRNLEDVEMPKITQKIADARAEGDLSENAEYHGQREAQGLLQARINQLKAKLANSYIVDKSSLPKGVVTFGSLVTVRDLTDGFEEQYEFVGPGEEDYSGEILKILTSSPLAKGLLGKKPGDQVEIALPKGVSRFEVVSVKEAE